MIYLDNIYGSDNPSFEMSNIRGIIRKFLEISDYIFDWFMTKILYQRTIKNCFERNTYSFRLDNYYFSLLVE